MDEQVERLVDKVWGKSFRTCVFDTALCAAMQSEDAPEEPWLTFVYCA